MFNLRLRDVTQASLILVFFHSGIHTCREKTWYPRPQFLFSPSISIHTHPPTLAPAPFFVIHPPCLFLPSHTLGSVQSQLCLSSHWLLPFLPCTSHRTPSSASTPPKTLAYFLFHLHPPSPLSSFCPSLFTLPNSPGSSWSSCTQPALLCMQACQLSFRLQQQELWEDKGKISPGTTRCCNRKKLNTESNQLGPQSPQIKCIRLSGHKKIPEGTDHAVWMQTLWSPRAIRTNMPRLTAPA